MYYDYRVKFFIDTTKQEYDVLTYWLQQLAILTHFFSKHLYKFIRWFKFI